jgi:hypothetical protein
MFHHPRLIKYAKYWVLQNNVLLTKGHGLHHKLHMVLVW